MPNGVNIAKMASMRNSTTDYEKSQEDIRCGRVNNYDSVDDLFEKMGM